MERLRTLNSYKIFKIKNKKLKTYTGWCPFKGLSNDTNLRFQNGTAKSFSSDQKWNWLILEIISEVTFSDASCLQINLFIYIVYRLRLHVNFIVTGLTFQWYDHQTPPWCPRARLPPLPATSSQRLSRFSGQYRQKSTVKINSSP